MKKIFKIFFFRYENIAMPQIPVGTLKQPGILEEIKPLNKYIVENWPNRQAQYCMETMDTCMYVCAYDDPLQYFGL